MSNFQNYLQSKGFSKQSITGHYRYVNQFINWTERENIETEFTTYNEILSYINSLQKRGIQQRTVQLYLNAVNHYFKWINERGIRDDNPTTNIQIKGVKRKKLYHILTKQELEQLYHDFTIPGETTPASEHKNRNWHKTSILTAKRNKVILGAMIYQGLTTQELSRLQVNHVKLREGVVYIPGSRKSNERTLQLEANQVLDLMEYTLQTRQSILKLTDKQTDQLFISTGASDRFNNIMAKLMEKLKAINPKITTAKQIRASVITHWLKNYNLREVQYKAGHRYVSSTESYLINDLDDLTEDINKFHPIA